MENRLMWDEQYNIGVDIIDKEHKKLFNILNKLFDFRHREEKSHFACQEAIKYFKDHAIQHFADEEAYMASINYPGLEAHKRIHRDFRERMLPALENELELTGYSETSIQHFLGICLGWLTGHIMLEDHAITGKISNKWVHEWTEAASVFEDTAIRVMDELFGLKTEIVSERYAGENFGKRTCYRLTYIDKAGKRTQVFFIFEEKLILYFINRLIGVQLTKINKVVIDAVAQICQQFMKRVAMYYNVSGMSKLEKNNLLTEEQFTNDFNISYPKYSLLFNTGKGYFALCVKD